MSCLNVTRCCFFFQKFTHCFDTTYFLLNRECMARHGMEGCKLRLRMSQCMGPLCAMSSSCMSHKMHQAYVMDVLCIGYGYIKHRKTLLQVQTFCMTSHRTSCKCMKNMNVSTHNYAFQAQKSPPPLLY